MPVKVAIYDKQNKIKLDSQIRSLIRKSCDSVLKSENLDFNAEIDVSLVDDEQIRTINRECRNIDSATDVLSFPLGENGSYDVNPKTGAYMLGDVIISLEHALFQGEEFGHGTNREIAYLTVHSVLHLLGYDHVNSAEERAHMRNREEAALSIMGLSLKGENND